VTCSHLGVGDDWDPSPSGAVEIHPGQNLLWFEVHPKFHSTSKERPYHFSAPLKVLVAKALAFVQFHHCDGGVYYKSITVMEETTIWWASFFHNSVLRGWGWVGGGGGYRTSNGSQVDNQNYTCCILLP